MPHDNPTPPRVHHPHQHWFVPLSHLRQPGGAVLRPVTQVGDRAATESEAIASSPSTNPPSTNPPSTNPPSINPPPTNPPSTNPPEPPAPIEAGSPFTLSLESFCISEELDRRSGNDLLARSWTVYGDNPPMEMVHCFKRNVVLTEVVDNLAIEHIFAVDHFDPAQPISLHLQILEVDGTDSIESDILAVGRALGGVFPALLPFTGVAIPLYKRIKTLFDQKRTQDAFTSTIQFRSADGRSADVRATEGASTASTVPAPDFHEALPSPPDLAFYSGAYVLCRRAINGEAYRLQDFRLVPMDGAEPPPSYAVIKVVPQLVRSHNPDDLLVNQQLAAALVNPTHSRELDMPEVIQAVGQRVSSLHYLQQVVKKARLLQHLQAYERLQRLQASESSAHESERDRLVRAERLQQLKATLAQELRAKP